MTGLEKIVNRILEDAAQESKEILDQAEETKEDILKRAREEADRIQEESARKSERETENYRKRAASAADLKTRTAVLRGKQETIALILEEAYERLCQEDADTYFKRITKMLQAYAQPQNGIIRFSQKDLDRMPESFEREIEKAAKEAGGSLKLDETAADIANGFVLIYGGIEENCTLRAVFDANKDELTDKVHKLLYR